jgi:hypothetical protein
MSAKITKWTDEKINELKQMIANKTPPIEIANQLGFSKISILTKGYNLGLNFSYLKSKVEWNDENISKLIKLNNEKKSHNEIAKEFSCSVHIIHKKLSDLRIKSKNVNYITDDEKQVLIELFNEGHTINYISKILKRSSPYLCKVAKDMGLVSKKSQQIQEQLSLLKEGKRKCRSCNGIFPYTEEFFRTRSMCKECSKKKWKMNYKLNITNITLEKLLVLRTRTCYGRACKKGLEFDITPEYLMEIYNNQKGLCFYSGIKMELAIKGTTNNYNTLSVDRIDSSKGYVKGNIVLCCDCVNTMKMKLTTNEFLTVCKNVVNHFGNLTRSRDIES